MADQDVFFHEATLLICGSFDIEQALYRTVKYLCRHMPAGSLHLGVLDPSGGCIHVIAKADAGGGIRCRHCVPLSAASRRKVAVEAMGLREQIVNFPDKDPIARDWCRYHEKQPESYMAMTLRLEGGGFGALAVGAGSRAVFQPAHAERLALIRRPFEIALANALKKQGAGPTAVPAAPQNAGGPAGRRPMCHGGNEIVGADTGLKDVMALARSVASVPTPVLLLGETGVGKEVIADAIHGLSPRGAGPMMKVNCGAIPDSLIDSELFGHEKGAFTGALRRRPGWFEKAHGGTIFLDEIGELPPEAQVRLLRVLQSGEIERVGGTGSVPTDIRLIAATHRDLAEMVATETFRQDLWFRINVFPIHIPPLRKRIDDIPLLVTHFLKRKCRDLGLPHIPVVERKEIDRLARYEWPGNVRELENMVERALLLARGARLSFQGLLPQYRAVSSLDPGPDASLPGSLEGVMADHIRNALRLTNGRIHGPNGAANFLGINPSTLRSRMIKLGIPFRQKERPARH